MTSEGVTAAANGQRRPAPRSADWGGKALLVCALAASVPAVKKVINARVQPAIRVDVFKCDILIQLLRSSCAIVMMR